MHLKHYQTVIESQNGEFPIAALAWSPNNKKLAVATCERTIYLFDELGKKRDKFSSKPSDPNAGKKSYTISCLGFSIESDMLAVGQSDNIIFVYRLGNDWETKKVICNKFPINSPCTVLYWNNPTSMLIGQLDGKIRSLECKTNKSSSGWSGNTACVSLSGFNGNFVVSGHIDGALIIAGNRLLARHPVSPNALCVLENAVLAAGSDKKIVIYDRVGRLISSFDYSKRPNQREFTVACANASGQAAIVGSYNACHVIEWSSSQGKWISGPLIHISGLYTVRSVAWSNDGSKIAIAGFTGATMIYEAMIKRWMCGKTIEAIRRGQGQLMLKKIDSDVPALTIHSLYGRSVHTVKVMGNDWYVVCRTESSLILCDMTRSLSSEVPWSGSGERFFFQHAPVCLIFLAGELTLIEYGINSILASVRTEFINPHLISVRINEDGKITENKKLAYLLDQKSICVMDLITGTQISQARLDARVDWLELSESAHVLLLRDRRRRLLLLNVSTGKMEVILSGVNFVQWVEGSDAVVAQTSTHVAIWYSINNISSVELMECGSGYATKVEIHKEIPRVVLQNGSIPYINLDHARLKFCTALRANDFDGCESYLNTLDDLSQTNTLWQQLASKAMELGDLKMAMRCQKALEDDAKYAYLKKTLLLSEEYEKENSDDGMNSPIVRARLAIYSYDLKTAEEIYVKELNEPLKAISMYTSLHRWPDALAAADRMGISQIASLKDQYMKYLISSGSEGEAATLIAARGDVKGALHLVLQADLPSRAAKLLKEYPSLLNDRDCYNSVLQALLRSEWWEQAGELCENAGDAKQAVELYAKANSYAKAVQKARQVAPHQVTSLEQQWGEWLMERRQWGAAVAHLIEAGDSRGALAAAVRAQQWAKALQIIQVIDDAESVQEYYEILANHFAGIQEWKTAEALWEAGGLAEEGARILGIAGQWTRALAFSRRTLGNSVATSIFQPEADRLKDNGNYKEAENLYVGLGLADAAIAMYEAAGRYKSLLRLVNKHRPQLLAAARRRIAQSLKDEGRLKQAEQYYLEADDWKGAIQMYRNLNQWDDAYRISQQFAPLQIQEQVLVAWSNSIEDDSTAARILNNHGALEAGIRWAARGGRWSRALALCNIGAPHLETAVRAQMASHLEDEGKLEEAEAEFVKGGSASEAISMWLHAHQYSRALSLAEQYVPEKETEVLQAYAEWAENQGDLPLYEALIIRAGRPQDVIKYYKENCMKL